MRAYLILVIVLLGLFNYSCSTTRFIKFSNKPDEIYTTEELKEFLDNNPQPKVVLRVPTYGEDGISSAEYDEVVYNDYIYAAIENVFLRNGFVIRDRKLFDRVAENASISADYEKIRESSDTDLIIELVRIEPKVIYKTNEYTVSNNRQYTASSGYERYGAFVEFKVVMLENAVFAGSYKFHYTPCTEGCPVQLSQKDRLAAHREQMEDQKEPYEGVELPVLEEFIKEATRELINSMR